MNSLQQLSSISKLLPQAIFNFQPDAYFPENTFQWNNKDSFVCSMA